jgi:hypothetical protein
MATLAVATPLLWSCSDGLELGPDASAPLSISLYSGSTDDETTTSRAAGDAEYYIGKTHLYLFASDNEDITAKYHQSFDAGTDYTTRTLHLNLNENSADISTIFGEGDNRICYAYIVANLPEDLDKQLDEAGTDMTIGTIKNFKLKNDFSKETVESFPMDGGDTITLNKDYTLTPKNASRIALKRAAVRIYINVYVRQSITLDGGTYNPMADDADIKLNNAVSSALLDKTLDLTDDDYIKDYSKTLAKSTWSVTHAEATGATKMSYYWYYTPKPFYSYPSNWKDNKDRNVNATICIPWRKTEYVSIEGTNQSEPRYSYNKYYYQIPIPTNLEYTSLDRNTQYGISVYLNVLGSSLKTDYVIPESEQLNFEITDWTDDGANITSSLDRNHYLVVQDNNFSLYNEDEVDIEYESCDDDVTAYVTEIKYLSTKDNETYYLYYRYYDSSSNTYKENTDKENYVDTDNLKKDTVRASVASMVSKVKYTSTTTDDTTDNTTNDSESDNYYLHFESAVSAIAEKLYRPVEYTIVLVNGSKHGSGRQTITITQYPSKYVEFGPGGNAFVNGYYANLVADAGYSASDLPAGTIEKTSDSKKYYQSYSFTYSKYSTDKQAYYGVAKDYVLNEGYIYGDAAASNLTTTNSNGTSYEFLNGTTSSKVVFENTIDVHVTAFSESYHSFNVNGSPIDYKIGDPREIGHFENDTHSADSYVKTGKTIYDYYTYGEYDGTNYYRHVTPWPNVDQIKIGGFSQNYEGVIAPLFKIQSTYGTAKTGVYFNVAQKRCATYQEAGYPAGRWRLPTLAEIAFIVKLQYDGAIGTMFNLESGSRGYWTSSGGIITKATTTLVTYTRDKSDYDWDNDWSGTYTPFVRCVYDLWYWGDTQEKPTHIFHPMPTASTSTTTTTTTSVKKTKSTNNVKRRR